MKKVGLIGGATWYSTIAYVQALHEKLAQSKQASQGCSQIPWETKAHSRKGAPPSACFASCDLLIRNLDFSRVVEWQRSGRFSSLEAWMCEEALALEESGCQAVAIASNTLSLAEPVLREQLSVPLISIFEAAVSEAKRQQVRKVLVLGTKHTMSSSPFAPYLDDGGPEMVSPSRDDQLWINRAIFEEFVWGRVTPESVLRFAALGRGALQEGFDGLLLGCTELGMGLLPGAFQDEATLSVIDSLRAHVDAIARFQFETAT